MRGWAPSRPCNQPRARLVLPVSPRPARVPAACSPPPSRTLQNCHPDVTLFDVGAGANKIESAYQFNGGQKWKSLE